MYLYEATKQEDKAEFLKAMLEEVIYKMDNGNFSIIKINQVPKGRTILPWVCKMKRKRHIKKRKIKRWKARLTVDVSRMTKGLHYDKVYAPVVSWTFIRLLLTMIVLHLIEQVIKDLGLNHDKVLSNPIPAASSKILFAHKESQPFDNSFHCRSLIGKLKES